MYECRRNRSRFWLRIYDNESATTLACSDTTRKLIDCAFPHLEADSPKGWKVINNNGNSLWLPNDCYFEQDIEELKVWAEETNKYIWLGTNKNTNKYFSGSELDLCVANDWNYDFETQQRTLVGEAEWQLKYHSAELSDENKRKYVRILANAVLECVSALPVDFRNFIVTTIPATEFNQRKLSWALARFISRTTSLPFVGLTLSREKPQMKNLSLENKVITWRKIYSDDNWVIVPNDIEGKNVLIIDDLFQSGASVFCLAEFLKECVGCAEVMAVTSVKAQKDGDNT